jgi:hypothetical protein
MYICVFIGASTLVAHTYIYIYIFMQVYLRFCRCVVKFAGEGGKLQEGVEMYQLFLRAFCALPLGLVLDSKVLAIHGGLFSKDGVTLKDINAIDRFHEPGHDRGDLMMEVRPSSLPTSSLLLHSILLLPTYLHSPTALLSFLRFRSFFHSFLLLPAIFDRCQLPMHMHVFVPALPHVDPPILPTLILLPSSAFRFYGAILWKATGEPETSGVGRQYSGEKTYPALSWQKTASI